MITKDELKAIFDQAVAARHAGRLSEARELHEGALLSIGEEQRAFLNVVHGELGYVYRLLGDLAKSAEHYRQSTEANPKSELASLGLFHALVGQEYWNEGMEEILRLVRLRDSPEYRELLSNEFCQGLPPDLQPLAYTARELLDSHVAASEAHGQRADSDPDADAGDERE